jgi:hypothetical protein
MGGGGYLVVIWLVYGLASVGLTFFLARTLLHRGTVFLQALFSGNGELARAVNGLVVVGFSMLTLGYSALLVRTEEVANVRSGSGALGLLVNRLGVLLVSLGVVHFLSMALFYWLGNRSGLRLRGAPAFRSAPPPAGDPGPPAAGPRLDHRLGTMGVKQDAPA